MYNFTYIFASETFAAAIRYISLSLNNNDFSHIQEKLSHQLAADGIAKMTLNITLDSPIGKDFRNISFYLTDNGIHAFYTTE